MERIHKSTHLNYVSLLEDLCKDEKIELPIYHSYEELDCDGSRTVKVHVDLVKHSYTLVGTGKTEPDARQSAASSMYNRLLTKPSTHFLQDVVPDRAVISFKTRSLENRPWFRRQIQQIKNHMEIMENHRGLIKRFTEHERINAMKQLNKEGSPKLRISKAATELGSEIIKEESICNGTEPPLAVVKLSNTRPTLSFAGLDFDDAASNCATYLKTILLENPELNITLKSKEIVDPLVMNQVNLKKIRTT